MHPVKAIFAPARLNALAASAAGAAGFYALDLPLPFMLGPMFGCLAAALAGVGLQGFRPVALSMRIVLGVAVGTAITPALVDRLPEMAYSVALVIPFTALIGLIGYPWFRKVCGFDRPTAYFSAMPGGMQDMLAFGEEAGGNVRSLSLVHATRVLVIVSLAPFLMEWLWGVSLTGPLGESALDIPLPELAVMAAAGVLGWLAARAVGLFGAPIIGPMAATAVVSLAGLVEHRPPAELLLAAQFFLGLQAGAEYAGVTVRELRRDVASALGYCLLLAGISLVFAEIVIMIGAAPPMEAFLAFAPGGQSEMAILAIVAGADLAYVVTHHLVRLIVVIIGAPIVARLLR
ncbi:MAG TPA: AbrB family transcriptional regulator [Thermohalobaculum sp.]|nr:AbrB family transcriptional regulator [Thermohalobaculum sp.]